MNEPQTPQQDGETLALGKPSPVDLEALLAAWQAATDRLQQTHQTLSAEVRRLTDELEAKNRQLARKNRLADLGQMASHIAHEVRNNLMPMTLYLSLLRRRLDQDPDALNVMDKIQSGFAALQSTLSDLLHFASERPPQRRSFPVRQLVREVCDALLPQLAAQHVRVQTDIADDDLLWADREMLRRAVLNLALNALEAMPDGGELTFTCWSGPRAVELEVADTGPGIPEPVQQRLFEPFFTTKSDGTGLGLAIVYRIAQAHGGQITHANCPEGGSAFTLRLPRRTMEAAA